MVGSLDGRANKVQFIVGVDVRQEDGLPVRAIQCERAPLHQARLRLPATSPMRCSTGPAPEEDLA